MKTVRVEIYALSENDRKRLILTDYENAGETLYNLLGHDCGVALPQGDITNGTTITVAAAGGGIYVAGNNVEPSEVPVGQGGSAKFIYDRSSVKWKVVSNTSAASGVVSI
ncbi:hypothetical protein [Pseudomonas sp. GM21]|jgi:hypothetical protein|uniref:hypothetical protein n=1 Tax=Pseudomonas sp. GM21 TaxID=1144325 RepID=UPI0012F7C736|nr:hypothetical protein [Pseudomonas sp. GM21]